MKQYYVTEPGAAPHGPYTEAMVKRAFEHGMYPPGTKVWWEGCANWIPVVSVFCPDSHNPVPPPPPPPPPPPYTGGAPSPTPSPAIPALGWNVINAFTSNMKRYVCFEGRSCRAEYWYFLLAQFILGMLSCVFGEIGSEILFNLMVIAFFVPNMGIWYRRLQDAGYNGVAGAVISGILDMVCMVDMVTESAELSLLVSLIGLPFAIVLGCMPPRNENNPYGVAPLKPL